MYLGPPMAGSGSGFKPSTYSQHYSDCARLFRVQYLRTPTCHLAGRGRLLLRFISGL